MPEREGLRTAVLEAATARLWICDDGHKHRRPEWFTLNRLRAEVNRRNARNMWMGATIACAIYDLIEDGTLTRRGHDLRLSVRGR